MSERKPYKTDLSDEQWALIEPVIAARKAAHPSVSGHQGRYEMREIVNALLYQGRTGCQWDLLPHDLPPRGAVMYYFTKWRDDGTDQATTTCCAGRCGRRRGGKPTRVWWCSTPRACTRRPGCLHSRRGVMRQKSTGPQARPGR